MNDSYVCPKCGYRMRLAPLKRVRVIHLPSGKHTYRISRPKVTQ